MKNDMRKLTIENDIKFEDMFLGEKVVNKKELCKNLGITLKKLNSMGGYLKVLEYFNLERPSPYYYENKEKIENFKIFTNQYLKEYGRIPFRNECFQNKIFGEGFLKNFGGYRKLVEYCGFEYKKTFSYSVTLNITKQQMIDDFKKYFNTKIAPSSVEVDIRYFNKDFYFGVSAINDKFSTYTEFIRLCKYEDFSNGNIYSKKHIAKDNHVCDSASEQIIDDFMFLNNIKHSIHGKYKDFIPNFEGRNKSDWILDDGVVVEYFGLKKVHKYNQRTEKKIKILEDNNISYIAIYPEDIGNLKNIFYKYLIKEVS